MPDPSPPRPAWFPRDAPSPLRAPWSVPTVAAAACGLGAAVLLVTFLFARRPLDPPRDRISLEHIAIPYRHIASAVPRVGRVYLAQETVLAGRPATLRCLAEEVGGEPNLYRWLGPFGMTDETGAAAAVWVPAAPETATVTCIARNSVGTGRASIEVKVLSVAR